MNNPAETPEGNEAYQEALQKLKLKTLLPVIECRMNNVLIQMILRHSFAA
jgi:hypothetical protein